MCIRDRGRPRGRHDRAVRRGPEPGRGVGDDPRGRLMMWVLVVLLSLTSVPLVAILVGLFVLPEQYEATVRATYKSKPEAVWAAIQDYQKHPMAGAQV